MSQNNGIRQYCIHLKFQVINRRMNQLEALYRIWCGVNRLGDSGVNRLGDTSAFVYPAGQLLLTWRVIAGVGIVFEFYIARL